MTTPLRIDWSGLVEDPRLFATLPPREQDAVYAHVAALEAVCRAQLLTRRTATSAAPTAEREQVVRLADAAQRLGMTKDFLHRHWPKLGGYKDDDGHVKFSLRTIERHIRSREAPR